ncbi:MAG: hypothetical protein WBL32_01030 [Acetivibrionales bacterium]|jgi:hypothetical protein|nr:hypothetical protein [Bacillota bacterium]NLP07077.1 hypothetical protein [Clostridiaceae bacterium]
MDLQAWIVSANMGLGHQRATYPLRDMAYNGVLLFGEDESLKKEKRQWTIFRNSYETLSRTRQIPLIGPYLFSLLEKLQNISPYYPRRDQSGPSLQVRSLYTLIRRGMGRGISEILNTRRLPVVTSFYAAAIAAEELTDLPVYCIICDADINRVWVAERPQESRIIYFAPCGSAMRRLKEYGVPDERIYLTGFPLPMENIGTNMEILKRDLARRLIRLDPTKRFRIIHGEEVRSYLGDSWDPDMGSGPITITYAVGGAGAQAEIAGGAVKSLSNMIKEGKVRLNLVAAHRKEVNDYFEKLITKHGLTMSEGIRILYNQDKNEYFRQFNELLHDTDILWTKPSEMSFYCGLGLPIIIAPPIGPHEVYNQRWLRDLGAGLHQSDPQYCSEWIMDYLVDGKLSLAAWDGFLYARKLGVEKIAEVLTTGTMERHYNPLLR